MIRLNNSKYITIHTDAPAATSEPQFITAYDDIDSVGISITPGGNDGVLDGANPIIVVDIPLGTLYRNVKYLSVYNSDTVARTITVSLVDDDDVLFF